MITTVREHGEYTATLGPYQATGQTRAEAITALVTPIIKVKSPIIIGAVMTTLITELLDHIATLENTHQDVLRAAARMERL